MFYTSGRCTGGEAELADRRLDVDAGFPFLRKELHLWSSREWSDLFRNKGGSHEQRALACAMLTNFVGW
jgi:hypothetical protein